MTVYSDAKYQISVVTKEVYAISVNIDGVNSLVPLDPTNTDYQNIMTLVAEGKLTIAPAEAQ